MTDLATVIQEAHDLGFLGPGPAASHIAHAESFLDIVEAWGCEHSRVVDLGTGGGVPGLVAAWRWPSTEFVFVEANVRRATFLRRAGRAIAPGRIQVVEDRAERAGRDPDLRGNYPLVMARSFAAPSVAAECAAPFLQVGGAFVVSEPPDIDADRWPAAALDQLGLAPGRRGASGGVTVQELSQVTQCPDRFPRRDGVPARKPLYSS